MKCFKAMILAMLMMSCSSGKSQNNSNVVTDEVADRLIGDLVKIKDDFEVHGHRGARARLPENTFPAFEYALNKGVDVLELDLQVTKDLQLVIAHDFVVNPELCTRLNGDRFRRVVPFFHSTLSEIKDFDCGRLKNPDFPEQVSVPGTQIPTLDEFFEWIERAPQPRAKKVLFNIETKMSERKGYSPEPSVFAKLLVEKLKEHKMLGRTIIQSFDFRTLMEARILEPKVKISLLFRSQDDFVVVAKSLNANYISPNIQLVNGDWVKKAQKEGLKVVPWTANTQKEWTSLIKAHVDGIITDDPEGLLKYLKR